MDTNPELEEKPIMTFEKARGEVNAWVGHKALLKRTIEEHEETLDKMAELIQEGVFELDDQTFVITHNLRIPVMHAEREDEVLVAKLTYKPRINQIMMQPYLKGVKPDDNDGRVIAYLACLTEENKQILKRLDSIDYAIGSQLVPFFIIT